MKYIGVVTLFWAPILVSFCLLILIASFTHISFTFYGSRGGILGQKTRCYGVFWTGCEVADLKQTQKLTATEHRNKIQSLV